MYDGKFISSEPNLFDNKALEEINGNSTDLGQGFQQRVIFNAACRQTVDLLLSDMLLLKQIKRYSVHTFPLPVFMPVCYNCIIIFFYDHLFDTVFLDDKKLICDLF